MGKKADFVHIIKENEGLIFKVSQVYAVDSEDQKDLYQEIVYQLWKSFESYKGLSKISTWMYRVALNTSITHFKREKSRAKTVSIDFELKNLAVSKDHLKDERIQLLYEQIKDLNMVEKSIIFLFLEGRSYDEMAQITGFSKTNVGTRLGRIKQKLKSQIKKS